MWSKLSEVFTEIEGEMGIPFSRQGSYEADEELPSDFFCFWNTSTEYDGFYDNSVPHKCIWEWNIYFYTNNPENIYMGLEKFIEKAREKGFIIKSAGKDLLSDEPDYFGRYLSVEYVEVFDNNISKYN